MDRTRAELAWPLRGGGRPDSVGPAMSVRFAASRGDYLLRFWYEPSVERAEPVAVRGDQLAALALAKHLSAGPVSRSAIRALLVRELSVPPPLDDGEVLRQLAARLWSGQIVVEHLAPVSVVLQGTEREAESARAPELERSEPKTWIEIELVDVEGKRVPNERYWIQLPDGSAREGRLDERGRARVEGIDPGTCTITFPALDQDAWEPA